MNVLVTVTVQDDDDEVIAEGAASGSAEDFGTNFVDLVASLASGLAHEQADDMTGFSARIARPADGSSPARAARDAERAARRARDDRDPNPADTARIGEEVKAEMREEADRG
jgi:hypothetical protein